MDCLLRNVSDIAVIILTSPSKISFQGLMTCTFMHVGNRKTILNQGPMGSCLKSTVEAAPHLLVPAIYSHLHQSVIINDNTPMVNLPTSGKQYIDHRNISLQVKTLTTSSGIFKSREYLFYSKV